MLFSKQKIEDERVLIRQQFLELYKKYDFSVHPPFDLKISYDPSLYFVNCSICHFKKSYFEGVQLDRYCVSQPALRTNTYRELQANQLLTYTAELEMLGAFSKCDNSNVVEELCTHILSQADFLRLILKNNRLSVDFSPLIYDLLDEHTIKYLSYMNIEVVIKKESINWVYGIDNIKGIGTNWNIYSKTQRCEFGNVVLLYKNEQYVGIESGGAIEALLRIINDFPHKVYANTYCTEYIAKAISSKKAYVIEYYDSLSVISNIAWCYKTKCPVQLKSILERYVRTAKCYCILHDVSDLELEKDIFHISKYHNYWSNYPFELYTIIKEYINGIWDVNVLIRNRTNKKDINFRGLNSLETEVLKKMLS